MIVGAIGFVLFALYMVLAQWVFSAPRSTGGFILFAVPEVLVIVIASIGCFGLRNGGGIAGGAAGLLMAVTSLTPLIAVLAESRDLFEVTFYAVAGTSLLAHGAWGLMGLTNMKRMGPAGIAAGGLWLVGAALGLVAFIIRLGERHGGGSGTLGTVSTIVTIVAALGTAVGLIMAKSSKD